MQNYLESVIKQFKYYRTLGDKIIEQVPHEKLFWKPDTESNSIAIIIKHLSGNMKSRWTDLFTTDGEKEWRNRETEFENDIQSQEELLQRWNEGWNLFLSVIEDLSSDDLAKTIYIRNEAHTVMEAINRQLTHYPYHVGQMVFIGKLILKDEWKSLSIPKKGRSKF